MIILMVNFAAFYQKIDTNNAKTQSPTNHT